MRSQLIDRNILYGLPFKVYLELKSVDRSLRKGETFEGPGCFRVADRARTPVGVANVGDIRNDQPPWALEVPFPMINSTLESKLVPSSRRCDATGRNSTAQAIGR